VEGEALKTYGFLISLLLVLVACASEVKPVLKPVELDIPARIEIQRQRLDQGIAAHEFTRDKAQPLKEKLDRIKEEYGKSEASGALTPKKIESLKRELDENSDEIYRLGQRRIRVR